MTAPAQQFIIGLVGGMSWESTALYYRLVNQAMQQRLGGHHNAASVLATLDFEPLLQAGAAGRWDEVAGAVTRAAGQLERAGADFFLLTANTAHRVAVPVAAATRLPLLHIGTPTARALHAAGLRRVGLLGTRHVTGSGLYPEWFARHHGIEMVPPPAADCALLDDIILNELTLGRIHAASRRRLLAVIDRMRLAGLQGVVVGCTELPLLLAGAPAPALACFDTARLHAEAAVDWALAGPGAVY